MSTNQDPQPVNPLPQGYPISTGQPPPGVQHETSGGFTDPPKAAGLDLRDLAPQRVPITFLDGNTYYMKDYNELGLLDAAALERDRKRMLELSPLVFEDKAKASELIGLYKGMIKYLVPDCPPEEIDRLPDNLLKAITDRFLQTMPAGLRSAALAEAGRMKLPDLPTLETLSQDSQPSTTTTHGETG